MKKVVLLNDALANEPKFLTMKHSDSHNKYGHHVEEHLRRMAKLKGFRLIGKMDPYDARCIVKFKAKPISKTSDPSKKETECG